MKPKLVIFDFDGTLADSFSWQFRVINEAADKYKFRPIEESELKTLRDYDAKKAITCVGIPMWKLPLIQRYIRKRMTLEIDRISLFPGVDQILRTLNQRGFAIAIVTSNALVNVHRILGAHNAALVQYYACDATIFGKRAKLRKVLRASAVRSSDAIFIGDEIRDLRASRAEKIPFGAVSWGFNSIESLARNSPDRLFANVNDILIQLARDGPH